MYTHSLKTLVAFLIGLSFLLPIGVSAADLSVVVPEEVNSAVTSVSTKRICGHIVQGDILKKYKKLGGQKGFLGCPTTDELPTPDGIGRFNHFQYGGSIYWTPKTGAHVVYGEIRRKWEEWRWEVGPLGYPITDERSAPSMGRNSRFQGGYIYWYPDVGAYVVNEFRGPVKGKYELVVFGEVTVHHACGWPCSSYSQTQKFGKKITFNKAISGRDNPDSPNYTRKADFYYPVCADSGIGGRTKVYIAGKVIDTNVNKKNRAMTVKLRYELEDGDFGVGPTGCKDTVPGTERTGKTIYVTIPYKERGRINRTLRLDDDWGNIEISYIVNGPRPRN